MMTLPPSRCSIRPPRVAEWIFRRIFPDREIFTTLGDLEEIFLRIAEESGTPKARLWYWGQLIKAIPHRLLGFFVLDIPLFVLSFKIMGRSLRKNKFFSFLNIFALTLGLTCFLLIFLYMRYEFTYDSFHQDHHRLYRVRLHNSQENGRPQLSLPLASLLKSEIPEIEQIVQVCHAFNPVVKIGQQKFESSGKFADENILKVFHFPLRRGIDHPLAEPYTVLLTESASRRFFGPDDPMGQTLSSVIRGESCELTVTGILADLPQNTHFDFELLISFPTAQALPRFKKLREAVSYSLTATYVKLHQNASIQDCEQKITRLLKMHSTGSGSASGFIGNLQPITDIHLRPDNEDNRSIRSLYLYLSLGIIILIIAGINYVNLSTSRSSIRMREIGIRKTIGAQRRQLVKQFIGEAVTLTLISSLLALILLQLILPLFNRLLDKNIGLDVFFRGTLWLEILGIVILVGVAAGLYPALFLSSFQPARILKGTMLATESIGFKPSRLRNVLVIIQFTVSVILINIMLFIHQQVRYIHTRDTGFDRSDIVEAWVPLNTEAVREKLLQNPNVTGVTLASNVISLSNRDDLGENFGDTILYVAESGTRTDFNAYHILCDHAFLSVFQIPLISGRNFSESLNESRSAIVNETFARQIGSENPLLKRIKIEDSEKDFYVIGVIRDFHFQPLTQTIKPLILTAEEKNFITLYAKIREEDKADTISFIRNTTNEFDPDRIPTMRFLDDRMDDVYRTERSQGTLLLTFASLAVLIACLGLFGLASFTAERKTKEIGIRKILGAETERIFLLLSKDFAVLSLYSVVTGSPLSVYFVSRWMHNFAYHVPILPWTFLLTCVLVLVAMLLTAGTQIVRITRTNPVEVLKYE